MLAACVDPHMDVLRAVGVLQACCAVSCVSGSLWSAWGPPPCGSAEPPAPVPVPVPVPAQQPFHSVGLRSLRDPCCCWWRTLLPCRTCREHYCPTQTQVTIIHHHLWMCLCNMDVYVCLFIYLLLPIYILTCHVYSMCVCVCVSVCVSVSMSLVLPEKAIGLDF